MQHEIFGGQLDVSRYCVDRSLKLIIPLIMQWSKRKQERNVIEMENERMLMVFDLGAEVEPPEDSLPHW
jgi:hypothetical protein